MSLPLPSSPSSLLPSPTLPSLTLSPLSLIPQGVVGTEYSLKSALVTAFSDGELDLEGDERGKTSPPSLPPSPTFLLSILSFTDGRTKTKLTVDGRCRLLLIREETGGPSRQLSLWADVIMYVFSYANSDSLREVRIVTL